MPSDILTARLRQVRELHQQCRWSSVAAESLAAEWGEPIEVVFAIAASVQCSLSPTAPARPDGPGDALDEPAVSATSRQTLWQAIARQRAVSDKLARGASVAELKTAAEIEYRIAQLCLAFEEAEYRRTRATDGPGTTDDWLRRE